MYFLLSSVPGENVSNITRHYIPNKMGSYFDIYICNDALHILAFILQNKDVVVMDMEAGIEHLGRGTAQGVDAFIVVVEPGERSLQTYRKVKSLGKDIGIKQVFVVGNKIRNKEDEEFIMSNIEDGEALGFIYYNQDVINSDRSNKSPYDTSQETREQIEAIKNKLMGLSVSCN